MNRLPARVHNTEALWADVRAIHAPKLLFRGENSKILSEDVAARTVAAMPDARPVVIPRTAHNVHSDNPADLVAALDSCLSEVLRAR